MISLVWMFVIELDHMLFAMFASHTSVIKTVLLYHMSMNNITNSDKNSICRFSK